MQQGSDRRVADLSSAPITAMSVASPPIESEEVERESKPTQLGPQAPSQPELSGPPQHDPGVLRNAQRLGLAEPATYGWQGLLNRFGMRLSPGAYELGIREDIIEVNKPLSRSMTVMVANPRGGAGKTLTSILLSGALGQRRGGDVVAWDNNETRGNMHLFTADQGITTTVADLLANIEVFEHPQAGLDHLARYLRHQNDGKFSVLASRNTTDGTISAADFYAMWKVLRRWKRVIVVDTGNNELSPNWLAASEVADVLVVPTKWKNGPADGAVTMLTALQRRAAQHHRQGETAIAEHYERLVANAIIVATQDKGEAVSDEKQNLVDYFTERGHKIVEIPADPHISAQKLIEHNALRPRTQRAALSLAAAVYKALAAADQRSTTHWKA